MEDEGGREGEEKDAGRLENIMIQTIRDDVWSSHSRYSKIEGGMRG